MNELNEVVVEETMGNVAEDVITADLDVAGANIAGTVVKVLLAVGVTVGAVALYKKVIKPKLAARKASKQCEEVLCEEASE